MFPHSQHFMNPNMQFEETYRCYSIGMLPGPERSNVNHGGKIILPPSALARLTQLNIEYPMLFELWNEQNSENPTHGGVLEFIAEEGRAYIPVWMMKTLLLSEGGLLQVKSTSLPLGQFVKIQPQSVAFLEISDPKAVLEQALRNFSCLTVGDIISFSYNDQIYEILVMETKPSPKGISVIETDLEVDFAPPLGYVEPDYRGNKSKAGSSNLLPTTSIKEHIKEEKPQFQSFIGSGNRLNGKVNTAGYGHADVQGEKVVESGIPPALVLPLGRLYFGYPIVPLKKEGEEETDPQVFTGAGQSLRAAKKKP